MIIKKFYSTDHWTYKLECLSIQPSLILGKNVGAGVALIFVYADSTCDSNNDCSYKPFLAKSNT
jgi:hypothetical protein